MPNVKGRIDQILLDNTARRILVAVWAHIEVYEVEP